MTSSLTDGTAHQWQPALFLLGLSFSFLLQAPLLILAIVLFVLMAVALGVATLGSGPGSDAFENFFLNNAVAVLFGCVVGGFLPVVICAPPFVTLDSFVRSPKRRFWRVALVGALLLGAVLIWGLLASVAWLWLVPTGLVVATVVGSFALLRYDRLWNVRLGDALAVHAYWLAFELGAMLTFGLVQELYTSRHGVHAQRFMRLLVAIVGSSALFLLGAMNVYLPNGTKIDNRYVQSSQGVFLRAFAYSEQQDEDGGVALQEFSSSSSSSSSSSPVADTITQHAQGAYDNDDGNGVYL